MTSIVGSALENHQTRRRCPPRTGRGSPLPRHVLGEEHDGESHQFPGGVLFEPDSRRTSLGSLTTSPSCSWRACPNSILFEPDLRRTSLPQLLRCHPCFLLLPTPTGVSHRRWRRSVFSRLSLPPHCVLFLRPFLRLCRSDRLLAGRGCTFGSATLVENRIRSPGMK